MEDIKIDESSLIIPIVFILTTLFVIALFFYKRAIHEFRINQVEGIDKAFQQLGERIPCVVTEFPNPHGLWNANIVSTRPSLGSYGMNGGDITLDEFIERRGIDMDDDDALSLAETTGIALWSSHTLVPAFKSLTTFGNLYSATTSAYAGKRGLHKTTASATMIIATDGNLNISIMHEQSEPYLPSDWHGRQLGSFTHDDTPLLGHIDYMDIIVRPDNALLLPAHWTYCIDTALETTPYYTIVEFHHPISAFVNRVLTVRGLK